MTESTRNASPRWRNEDLAEMTAKTLALAALISPVVGVVANDQPRAPRDGREAA